MLLKMGEKIKQFREKNNITQSKMAEYLGITEQAISRWENGGGYPDIEMIPAISKFLNISIDELFEANKKDLQLEVQVGSNLLPLLGENQESDFLKRVKNMKQKISEELGFMIDYITFCDNVKLPPNCCVIKIKGEEALHLKIIPENNTITETQFLILNHLSEIIKKYAV